MTTDAINIEAEPVALVPVKLVGQEYQVNPPKAALSMRMAVAAKAAGDDPTAVFEVLEVWIDRAFGKSAKAVKARLDDDKDLLDISHIMTLMEKITEKQTANPSS